MHYLPLLFVILQTYKALSEEEFVDTTLKLAKNMIFECVYPGLDIISQAEWFQITTTGKNSMAIFSPSHGGLIRTNYSNRVEFLHSNVTANISLSFLNASKADLGLYYCILYLFPFGHWEKIIKVVQSDDFETRVSSNSHMVSEPGKNVKFIFQTHMASPLKQVTWERIQPHQIDHLTSCDLIQGRSYGFKYQRQISTSCSQETKSSSIVIHNVTASDSGYYQCSLMTITGENETFVMTLTVTDAETNHQFIFFIIGGAGSFLILVIFIIIIRYCYRRNKEKKILSKALWDDHSQPTHNYDSTVVHDQNQDYKEEDIYVNCPVFSQRSKSR